MLPQSTNDDESRQDSHRTTPTTYYKWLATSLYPEPPRRFFSMMTDEEVYVVTYLLDFWVRNGYKETDPRRLARDWREYLAEVHYSDVMRALPIDSRAVLANLEARDLAESKEVYGDDYEEIGGDTYVRFDIKLWRIFLRDRGII